MRQRELNFIGTESRSSQEIQTYRRALPLHQGASSKEGYRCIIHQHQRSTSRHPDESVGLRKPDKNYEWPGNQEDSRGRDQSVKSVTSINYRVLSGVRILCTV